MPERRAIVAERHGNGGVVADAVEKAGQRFVDTPEQSRGGMGRRGEDQVIGLQRLAGYRDAIAIFEWFYFVRLALHDAHASGEGPLEGVYELLHAILQAQKQRRLLAGSCGWAIGQQSSGHASIATFPFDKAGQNALDAQIGRVAAVDTGEQGLRQVSE